MDYTEIESLLEKFFNYITNICPDISSRMAYDNPKFEENRKDIRARINNFIFDCRNGEFDSEKFNQYVNDAIKNNNSLINIFKSDYYLTCLRNINDQLVSLRNDINDELEHPRYNINELQQKTKKMMNQEEIIMKPKKKGSNPPPSISQLLKDLAKQEQFISQTHECDTEDPDIKWFVEDKKYYKLADNKKTKEKMTLENTCDVLNFNEDKCTELLAILDAYEDPQQIPNLFKFVNREDNKNIWPEVNDALTKIHPRFILYLLHAFGFSVNVDNQEIICVDYWIKHTLPKYLNNNQDQVNNFIANNTKLLNLLACFVNFINNNTGILKKEQYYTEEDYNKKIQKEFPMTGYKNIYSIKFDNMAEAFNYLNKSRNYPRNSNLLQYLVNGPDLSNLYIPGPTQGVMSGGSMNGSVQVGGNRYSYQLGGFYNEKNKDCGSKYAQTIFSQFRQQLNAYNKKLADKDVEHFDNLIINLKKYESQVNKYLTNIHKYLKNATYSDKAEVLTRQEIQRYVNNYKFYDRKFKNQESKLLDALFRFATVVEKLEGNRVNERDINMADIM